MHSLDIMKDACTAAIEAEEEGWNWQTEYATVVDPASVLEMIEAAQRQVATDAAAETGTTDGLSNEELQAFTKLVRDLTGFIKMNTGGKADPVRDDLVLQANQLLGLAGL